MQNLKFILSTALIALAAASVPGLSNAAPTTFFGSDFNVGGLVPPNGNALFARNAFLTAVNNSFGESFESTSIVNGTAPTSAVPLSVFGNRASLFNNSGTAGRIQNDPFVAGEATGRFNTTSSVAGKWWETDSSFSLTFSAATQALGFYGTDFGDFEGALTLSFFLGLAAIESNVRVPLVAADSGSLLFFGYVNTQAFDRVVFNVGQFNPNNPGTFDVLGFDDFLIGTANGGPGPGPNPVPEPGTLALVALSLGLLAARRRR